MTETQQARLYSEVAGLGSPVVLIHAGVCDSRMWDEQWEAFQAEHKVVRVDLRGYGRSPYGAGRFAHPADLIELLDELKLGPAALVGVSLGGGVALQVAIARPDLVSSLVLVGAGIRDHEWSEEVKRAWTKEGAAFERGDLDAAVEISLRTWVDGPRRSPEDVAPVVRAAVAEMQRRALELELEAGDDVEEDALVPDVGERLGEISVPVLVVVGDLDVEDVHVMADRLEREIPAERRAGIEGAAHVPNMEQPERFNQLVLGFLAEHEA